MQSSAQLEQGLFKKKIRCQCSGDCKNKILRERVYPCVGLSVEKQLLPQIEGIAEDAHEHNRLPIE